VASKHQAAASENSKIKASVIGIGGSMKASAYGMA